jgi:hypothetical protein
MLFLPDSGHHNIKKEQPISLKEDQCCIHGIDLITMVSEFAMLSIILLPFGQSIYIIIII